MQDNIGHARIDLQRERMLGAQQKGICCFCRENFEEYHTAPVEFENDHWLVSRNDFPYDGTETHLLLVSKRHVFRPKDLTQDEWAAFHEACTYAMSALPGGTLLLRFGQAEYTGATIAHLHAHVISGASGKQGDEKIVVFIGYKKKTAN